MAVWLKIWGRSPHDLSDEKVVEELKERIKKVELNFDFLAYNSFDKPDFKLDFDINNEITESIRAYFEGKQRKFLSQENWKKKYNPDNWEIAEVKKQWITFTYYFNGASNSEDRLDNSFSFSLGNNIASFTGDFDTFSKWFELCRGAHENLREGWQELIRTLFRLFDIKQAIYFSEWGFGHEDCENFDELLQWIEERPELIIHKLKDLHEGNEFYIENLS